MLYIVQGAPITPAAAIKGPSYHWKICCLLIKNPTVNLWSQISPINFFHSCSIYIFCNTITFFLFSEDSSACTLVVLWVKMLNTVNQKSVCSAAGGISTWRCCWGGEVWDSEQVLGFSCLMHWKCLMVGEEQVFISAEASLSLKSLLKRLDNQCWLISLFTPLLQSFTAWSLNYTLDFFFSNTNCINLYSQ